MHNNINIYISFKFNNGFIDDVKIADHCQNIIDDGSFSHVFIKRTEFNEYYHEDNGGAIHMINSGLTCNDASFETCYTTGGGGGGIYIYNEYELTNNITLKNLTFKICSAVFGGAIYIYSISENNPVLIENCKFLDNIVIGTQETSKLYGGSAVYLTVSKCHIIGSRLKRNKGKGGSMKINTNFDEKPKNNNEALRTLSHKSTLKPFKLNSAHSISITKCSFEMGDDLQSSLIFANVHQPIKTRLRDCSFSGKLAKDSFYIDGQSVGGSKPNFKINGCTFGSELKNRFNSKFISEQNVR